MIRLYADANLHGAITQGLRERGIEVLTAQEDHADRLADPALLARVTELERVLLTHDRDFLTIGAAWQTQGRVFSGVVLVTLRDGIGVCVEDIALLAQVETMESLASQVLFVPF
jgi:predicted nuclease of predicted toxin-antitoxin system